MPGFLSKPENSQGKAGYTSRWQLNGSRRLIMEKHYRVTGHDTSREPGGAWTSIWIQFGFAKWEKR